MRVKQLLLACQQQVLNWNWEKEVYISSDDEWNDFHELFYWFTYLEDDVKGNLEEYRIEDIETNHQLKDIILLG